ncbi:ROK family protein [Clostridium intestinale]|uniref:Sugar kinase of the NBD/HSP70 family, may contain an N-terminal HTH domain n=1 Tax=Clostridium intestinale DSM 6191 TaxID=1121320 RepID=A0A1M6BP81_9CLOT|nr:ROK family protein [Clostridium intestinale]SHI50348.1 Sugar kinase of the NBD/HSP70 family, may contain an N-terminal HTH domain [Clostridium intestinale DSM 6191]
MSKILVMDIGGSATKTAIIENNEIVDRDKIPTSTQSLEEFVDNIDKVVNKVKPTGIAISIPGLVNSKTGLMKHGGSLSFIKDFNMKTFLQERYKVKIAIENDGKCAALGELYKGKLQGCEDGVVIVIGTGIGGGIIANGKLLKGEHLSAGEFSFVRTNDENPENFRNAWGAKGSSVGLVKRVKLAKGIEGEFDGIDLFKLIEEEDEIAVEAFNSFCKKIAVQIVNIQVILDPKKIIIGGGISAQKILTEKIQAIATELNTIPGMYTPEIIVEQSELGNDANIYGAYYNYIQEEL